MISSNEGNSMLGYVEKFGLTVTDKMDTKGLALALATLAVLRPSTSSADQGAINQIQHGGGKLTPSLAKVVKHDQDAKLALLKARTQFLQAAREANPEMSLSRIAPCLTKPGQHWKSREKQIASLQEDLNPYLCEVARKYAVPIPEGFDFFATERKASVGR